LRIASISSREALQEFDGLAVLTIQVTDSVTVQPAVMVSDAETVTVTDAITLMPSVMLADSEQIHVTDAPALTFTVNTPLGQSTVIPPDQNGQASNISVTFSGGVTVAGYTFVNISPTGPPLPAGFQLTGSPAVYFDIQTTAQFNPPVVVCIPLASAPVGEALLHFNTATQQWEDFTIKPVPSKGPICAQVNSLSPFAVVAPSNHPPTASGGSNQVLEVTGPAGTAVSLIGSASDPDNDPLTLTWSENGVTLGTGAQITVTFSVGAHTVTLTADDGHGGSGTSTVLITVQDTTPPALTLPASQVIEATSPAGAVAIFNATATDLVDGTRPVFCSPPSGSTFPLGVTTVSCTASDLHGNTSSGQFTITVRDTRPPVVVPPANITVPATESGGARAVAWPTLAAFLAGASATDIADPAPTQLLPQAAGVNLTKTTLFPYGTTTVTFRFRHASGNVGTAKATVTVILGTVKISAKMSAQGLNPDGTTFVDVTVANIGTGNARTLKISLITAVPTKGYGRIALVSPTLPLTLGNLDAGVSHTVRITLKVPATVKQFALAEAGSYTNVKGSLYFFAQAQTIP
jgi:HYR domain